jgi:hypothetical protein
MRSRPANLVACENVFQSPLGNIAFGKTYESPAGSAPEQFAPPAPTGDGKERRRTGIACGGQEVGSTTDEREYARRLPEVYVRVDGVIRATGLVVWTGLGIQAVIILIVLAFWPARVDRRKGHSWLLPFFKIFTFSPFFFFPASMMIYLVRDRRRL